MKLGLAPAFGEEPSQLQNGAGGGNRTRLASLEAVIGCVTIDCIVAGLKTGAFHE